MLMLSSILLISKLLKALLKEFLTWSNVVVFANVSRLRQSEDLNDALHWDPAIYEIFLRLLTKFADKISDCQARMMLKADIRSLHLRELFEVKT
jgi:hypothetical protein